MESLVFTSFLLLQIAASRLPELMQRFSHLIIVQRISRNHYMVWLAHPVVVETVHEYLVHFIIYSGYVLHVH